MSPTASLSIRTGLVGLFLMSQAAIATAQQPTSAEISAMRENCRSDYMSYCSSVPTGGRAALQCLQEHLMDLSPACQSAVSATEGNAPRPPAAAQSTPPAPAMSFREEARLLRGACGEDFRTWCDGVRLGGGRALACLMGNESYLSPGCKGALGEVRAAR